jgi:rhodanese-related sulfurtransferase
MVKSISKETLKSWLGLPELFLADVRSPEAFDRSIAKIELAHRLEPDKVKTQARKIPKHLKVVLYCENGTTECPRIAQHLDEMGFKKVFVLEGGWKQWSGKDYPAVPKELADGPELPAAGGQPRGRRRS